MTHQKVADLARRVYEDDRVVAVMPRLEEAGVSDVKLHTRR